MLQFRSELPESAYMHELVGCHLLCLLSQNKLAQFHSELEMISIGDLLNNIYIRHPVSIEQYLMEGSYNKVSDSYLYFRNHIAMLLKTLQKSELVIDWPTYCCRSLKNSYYLNQLWFIRLFIAELK